MEGRDGFDRDANRPLPTAFSPRSMIRSSRRSSLSFGLGAWWTGRRCCGIFIVRRGDVADSIRKA